MDPINNNICQLYVNSAELKDEIKRISSSLTKPEIVIEEELLTKKVRELIPLIQKMKIKKKIYTTFFL